VIVTLWDGNAYDLDAEHVEAIRERLTDLPDAARSSLFAKLSAIAEGERGVTITIEERPTLVNALSTSRLDFATHPLRIALATLTSSPPDVPKSRRRRGRRPS